MIFHKEWSLCEAFGLVSSRVKGTGWIIILYVPLGLDHLVRLEEDGWMVEEVKVQLCVDGLKV
jgi:hypothetical protein